MAITAKMVKELREQTGAGMMECKKALAETNGDMAEAVEYLRKNGQAKAEKKASRIAAEGLCLVANDGDKKAVVVEVNSETDFVASNEKFQTYVKEVAEQALNSDAEDMDSFMAEKWAKDPSKTVQEALVEEIAVIGEKLSIRRFERVSEENGFVVSYTHGGGRISVLVDAECAVVNDEAKEAVHNIAMQIAALNPKYLSDKDVDQDFINHETEIIKAQIENDPKESQKPDKVKEGMVKGRLNKELKEVCLMDQPYVKAADGKQTVQKYLDEVSKSLGSTLTLKKFVRFETGEGMEKKNEDFAAEVAAQING
ncbi:translation elongation factor Ts [Lachnospiraceae bacterium YH-ros2228]|jgi:elongation factor Ts|nr:translation elongation factor Ts [Lachnospiraceae bacterium]MDD6451667.1 translation elongation factor Ts [Lachnospiraceae bacterium]MDD6578463.1 translation elongation factor Ts [Lachnospiraceae bacterium]